MLINDEEEKKKRLEEAMQITNSINSNNYQDDFSTNNNSFDDEYSQRLQEAMSITNSINPINNDEETSFDIDATPDMDISTINENKQVGYDDEQKNNNANISDKISYIGKRISSGMVGGITGIAQAALTDTANNMQKGKNKPIVTSILNSVNSIINPMSSSMQNVLESQKESIEIIKDKDKSLLQKFVNLLTKASSDSIDTMLPSKKAIAQTAGNIVPGIDNAVLNFNEQISTPIYNWKNKLYEEGQNYGAITNTLGNVGEAVGNMIPSITTTMVTGSPTVGLATMGISAKGQSTQEALERGADLNEAVRIGDTKGMVEIGTEMLTGGVNIFGRGALDDITDGIVNNVSNNVARFFVKQGFDVAGENLEETISDIVGTIIDKGTVDPDASYSIKDWQKTTLETTLTTFALNILTGGLINDIHNIKNDNNLNETKTEIDVSDIKPFFVLNKNADGNINNINYVNGIEIDNPNKDVNIKPAIIKNNETNRYNVIDTETGILLDTTPYEDISTAKLGFNSIMLNLSENQINDINKNITETQITLYKGIDELMSEDENINIASQNQQNDTIEQNNIQGQEINSQNNKIAQNGISEQTNKTNMEQRNWNNVSDKNVKSYQTENPEVSQEIQEMAYNFQEDLANSTFGERYKAGEEWTGTKRSTTKELAEIKDDTGASWGKIQKALEDISQGKGDYALAKKVELVLDKALSEGYKNIYGKNIMPNESYLTKKGKIEGKNYLQNETETSTGIESNPEENRIFGERINKKGGNSNVRAEQNTSQNTRQEINRAEKRKNTKGEKEISRSNGASQEKLSKSIQQFQREQQKQLGKDTKISLTEQNKLTNTERTIQKEFENITGLNYGVYESNKGTEDAVYVNNDILIKHNSSQSKKKSNFLPFHELGHWFKVNRKAEWTAIHDIIDNTITKNQIEEYKNVLKDKSMFDNMSEAEIRDYIIEEIESDYFGNWANDISNWADVIRNKMLSDEYVQLLIDISDENISTHYNIFGTQEQQEQVYNQINEMMNNFITENKNSLKSNSESNTKQTKDVDFKKEFHNRIQNALINKNSKRRTNFGIVDSKTATRINKITGINVEQRKHILLDNDIRHMINEHSDKIAEAKKKQIPITPKDIELIPDVINEYDKIIKGSDNKGEQTIRYIKNMGKNKIYVVEVVPSIQNDLIIKTMWIKPIRVINSQQTPNLTSKTKPNAGNSTFVTNSIAQKNKTVKSDTATNSNMQKSKNNTIKKSDRTLFNRNNQDLYYDYSEEVKGKNTSTYSNAKMRELIQANDIKQIDNKKQFIRTVIEREGNSYWGNMFKDSTLRDVKYKNEIIQSYLEKQNENNIIVTDSEGRKLTKEQQNFYKGNDVVNENGNLQVVYHGTPFGKFTKFNDKNVYFFSVDRGFAEDYAYAKNFEQALDGDVEVMEVYLKAKNVFDPSKESDIQKLREALPEQIRFFATTFDKETFLQRIQRIDDLPPMWTKEQIKNAKFGRVIGDDRYGYNNDIFVGVNKNNEVVYAKHTYGTALEHLTTKEQEEAKKKLLNGEDYVVTIYATPFGQMTEDAIREKYSQLENEHDKRYLADTIRYLDEGKLYMLDDSTYKISPYTASQEAEHLTDIDNWEYIEGSNAWENNEVGKDVIDIIRDLGYDGLKIYEKGKLNYAVFNKNQIKRVDNKKPTNNPDIRYSNRYDTEENGEGGFYSQLEKVIEEKMPNTSNAQQIKGIIENSGIKQDEIKWIGLDDYLKQHSLEKISKQQLQDYIKANQINIKTVRKSMDNLEAFTSPIKKDIENKKVHIRSILDEYNIDYEDDDVIPYKRNGLLMGTIGDFLPEELEKLVDLDSFEKDGENYINEYIVDGIKWTYEFSKQDFKKDMQALSDLYEKLNEAQMNLSMAEDEYGDNAEEIGTPKFEQYSLEGGTNYQEILYTLPLENQNQDEILKLSGEIAELRAKAYLSDPVLATDEERIESNKIYAEINKRQEQIDRLEKLDNVTYKSPHWEEKNVLAHARTQDFEDTDGNKVLFIDEIQSDLHQEGRKKGYINNEKIESLNNLRQQLLKGRDEEAKIMDKQRQISTQMYQFERENEYVVDKIYEKIVDKTDEEIYEMLPTELQQRVNAFNASSREIYLREEERKEWRKNPKYEKLYSQYYELENKYKDISDKNLEIQNQISEINTYGISDIFPFKKNWHEFVLRRMINNAVEQGYDEVAWTTGRQQRERYSLSKAIDYIVYQKRYDTSKDIEAGKVADVVIRAYKDGNKVFDREIKANELDSYIGKDLSMRILNSKENDGEISNLDEEIRENGNSGMYVFYDQEIPNYLNKYLKKWNSKVEEITLMDADGKTESKQMGFKITDEMRNSIKQNGQPLFSNRQLDEEEASTYDERIQRKNRELIKELREQKESIQGLEGYSRTEIKDIVNNYIQDKLVENDLEDISINGAEIIGSRNRGNAKTNSDLDLVVEYSGDIREDDLFNILNEEPLEIEGIKVDINPITADNTGTLEEYLERSKQYDREVLNATSKETIRKEDPNVAPGATNAQGANRFIEQEIRKIEASGNWDNSIPVTKLTDIRKTIEDYLGLGIKKGHFRERAYGIYKEGRDVIRGKELKDIDNILHETGHALDLGNRLKIDKESIANELLTAIQKHGGYENETRSTKLDEGFAEVIRTYSIIPEQAKADYPQSVAILEEIRKADKSFDDFIRKVQQQTYNYIHQNPQNRVHSNISVGESNRTPLTKAWLEQEVMRNIWDKDYAVKKVVSEIAKIGGKTTNQIKASNNAYYLTRLATGIHDKATSMLSDGYINEKGEKIMPGLNKVGEILGDDPQRYNDLRDYLVAKRDTDYKAKTLKTGIRDMDTKYVLEKFANDTQIKDAAQVVYDTLDGVMKYAVDNGLISEETAKDLKNSNAFYVPMQRVIEGRGNQLGRKGAVSDIIKARTGSELDIKDVLENIVSNSTNIIQQVENNNVLRALYNQGEEAGLTGSIYDVIPTPMTKVGTANLSMWESELQKQGVNTAKLDLEKTIDLFVPNNKVNIQERITSFINEDGKRVYLQFDKKCVDLFNALMNLDGKTMSFFLKINARLNMPLRYGATMANIGFAIPNMISDTAQAAIFSNAGFIPVVDNALGVLDILTATNKHVRNFVKNYSPEYVNRIENMYNLYKQSGATSSTRMSQFRDSTQSNMKDIYGTKNSKVLGINEKWKPLKRLLDIMTYIPEISEQSTRFRVFERNYDMYKSKGNSEMDARILAALESRDATQDFGRTGNLTREINQLIPFSAARVGSSYTFAEKVKANPKRTAMRIAILSALALAIKAIGYDDKEIEELNQRKKDDNFVLRVGDNVVTIKKPQGLLRSIVNLTEYIEDLATGHIEDGKEGERLGEWINNAIMDNAPADSVTGLVPNMVAPLIENAINKDLYYNTDIVKSYDLDLPDSQQYYEYNSQLAILLGKVFNYSPAKIDNLISGYFAGLGTQVTNIMDYASGKLGITAQKAEMGAESNAVGKRFIVNVNSNSASVDEIYNRKTELTKKKNGGTITSEEEAELSTITTAVTNMSKVNKQIKEIKRDLTMSGKEKAEQIKELQRQRTDIARQALGKDLLDDTNSEKIETTSFYPTNSSLSLNKMTLELTPEMKEEYSKLASEFYKKYEKQGLYSEDKLKQIKTKAKDYAKKTLMQKYKSQLVKSK